MGGGGHPPPPLQAKPCGDPSRHAKPLGLTDPHAPQSVRDPGVQDSPRHNTFPQDLWNRGPRSGRLEAA